MAQPVTRGKSHTPSSIVFDTGQWIYFAPQASVAAAQAGSTVVDWLPLPTGGKVILAVASFSAIGTPQSGTLFNVVVGGQGTYETGASTGATQTFTVGSTFSTGDTITATIAGIPVTATATQNSETATSMALALQNALLDTDTPCPANAVNIAAGIAGLPLNRVVSANHAAGVLTVGALDGGVAYNSIPTVAAVSSASGTFVAGGATLAGGVAATGIVLPSNDTVISTGLYTAAPSGSALFGNDQVLIGAPVGSATNQALHYAYRYQPYMWDAVIAPGSVLTLRLQTPASTGTITNLRIGLFVKPYDPKATNPSKLGIPNAGFLPLRDIG